MIASGRRAMVTRRAMAAASLVGVGVAVGGGWGRAATVRAQRTSIGGGLAGGGTVATEAGEAQFSVFGTNVALADDDGQTARGQLFWIDGDLTLESVAVTEYGPIEGDEAGRRMRGTLTAGGADGDGEEYPFTLTAHDFGLAGEEADTISLVVGGADAATPGAGGDGFSYEVVDAPLTAGDLQLISFADEE